MASLRLDLHIGQSRSLKAKRAVVKPIVEGARSRFGVAVAEVAHQDRWQRAAVGVAAVGSSPAHVADVLDAVERFVWSFPEVEVIDAERAWLEA